MNVLQDLSNEHLRLQLFVTLTAIHMQYVLIYCILYSVVSSSLGSMFLPDPLSYLTKNNHISNLPARTLIINHNEYPGIASALAKDCSMSTYINVAPCLL
jgi:hypothetical protein